MALNVPSQSTMLAGGAITTALWNSNIRDAVNFLVNPPLAVLFQAVAQSIPNNPNPWTAITFDSTLYDTYSGHSNVTNNSRWTCPAGAAGVYEVTGGVAFATSNLGNIRGVGPALNGTQLSVAMQLQPKQGTAPQTLTSGTVQIFLNATDYLQMFCYQDTGGALNTTTGQFESYMSLRWVHA